MSQQELENIKERYQRRNEQAPAAGTFEQRAVAERNKVYQQVVQRFVSDPESAVFLEAGAGTGGNLPHFIALGFRAPNIIANELLEDRVRQLQERFPDIQIIAGSASGVSHVQADVVFQSMMLSSVLDESLRRDIAGALWKAVKPGGILLSYDFAFNNPRNPDVKKLTVADVRQLFPEGEVLMVKKVTLAPPIGRRVGRLYAFFNAFPFLRTHRVVVIRRKA
jgi:phospholipid N-methyltransferase